jgi:hypothetical protein
LSLWNWIFYTSSSVIDGGTVESSRAQQSARLPRFLQADILTLSHILQDSQKAP